MNYSVCFGIVKNKPYTSREAALRRILLPYARGYGSSFYCKYRIQNREDVFPVSSLLRKQIQNVVLVKNS